MDNGLPIDWAQGLDSLPNSKTGLFWCVIYLILFVHTANLALSLETSEESRLLVELLAVIPGKILELSVVTLEQRHPQTYHTSTPLEHT